MPSQRPPSLFISTAAPATPIPSTSQHRQGPSNNSPFRYVQLPEKQTPRSPVRDPLIRPALSHPLESAPSETLSGHSSQQYASSSPAMSPVRYTHPPSRYGPLFPLPATPIPPRRTECFQRPSGITIPDKLKPWLGIASWLATSIGFLLAIAFWKKEVFTGLEQLSLYLQSLGTLGHSILFGLIFITTIPPFPLYSTLIVLSGYTFGTWTGAAISYSAALSGAVVVFLVSRRYLRGTMSRLLSHTLSLKRVVRAIEKRPRLLLLIRVAPYPYNVMNVLLAASHTLSFSTYFWCTALSLCKVVIHTSVGSGIHSFAGHHLSKELAGDDNNNNNNNNNNDGEGDGEEEDGLGKTWTIVGIMLCIGILVYLSIVARRAVEEELEDEDQDELVVATASAAEEGRRLTGEAEMREVSG